MMNTYEQALDWIHSRQRLGIKPGLQRMEWMLQRTGNPERRLKTIHVAGTNGKGSTVSYLRHILQEAGYRVGTFISPYIQDFNERIGINGEYVSNDDLVELVNQIIPLADELEDTELGGPSEFEVVTMMSILYFAKINIPDIVLYETGLGGRFDSTNVIQPLVSVITTIGYDHMEFLGDTLDKIAYEKAGIIKPGVPVVTGVNQPEALEVIKKKAITTKSKSYIYRQDFIVNESQVGQDEQTFSYTSPFYKRDKLSIQMKGSHQIDNAALALMTIDFLKTYYSFIIEEEAIDKGLRNTTWPGRFETISKEPLIILDGAHNPEGIESLVKTVQATLTEKKVHILFASTKVNEKMVHALDGIADQITFTTFEFPRAVKPNELYDLSQHNNKHMKIVWKEAIVQLLDNLEKEDVLLITGSLYFISEVRGYLLSNKS